MAYIIYSHYMLNRTVPNEVMYQYQMAASLADAGEEVYLVFKSMTPQPGTQVLPGTNVFGICMTDAELSRTDAYITLCDRIRQCAVTVNQEYIHIIPDKEWLKLFDNLPGLFSGPKISDITYTTKHKPESGPTIAYVTSENVADTSIPLVITPIYSKAFSMHRDPSTGNTGWKLSTPGQVIYPGDVTQLSDLQVNALDELSLVEGIEGGIKCIPGGIYQAHTYVFPFMGRSNLIDSLYIDAVASGARALAIDPPEWVQALSSTMIVSDIRPNVDRAKQWIRDALHIEKHRMGDNSNLVVMRHELIIASDWEWLNLATILNATAGV